MNLALQDQHRPGIVPRARETIIADMQSALADRQGGVYELVRYHLGWTDAAGVPCDGASGKMLRPVLCLVAAEGYGAADRGRRASAAIELVHAFSLVHDDIEDGDRERRHRPTLWTVYGVGLAINAGDSLFALAHRVLADACAEVLPDDAVRALRIFDEACQQMIQGQHADLSFESRPHVSTDEYELMAAGKTGALMGAALALGAHFAGAPEGDVRALEMAGVQLGVAFQAVDDALAVWGAARATGKPVGNDVARGKKSLPVVLAAEAGLTPNGLDGAGSGLRAAVQAFARKRADAACVLIEATAMSRASKERLRAVVGMILEREV